MMNDPSDSRPSEAVAQPPNYYADSYVGRGIIGLLYEAIDTMRRAGCKDTEIDALLHQAMTELAFGLNVASFPRLDLH